MNVKPEYYLTKPGKEKNGRQNLYDRLFRWEALAYRLFFDVADSV